MGVERLGELEAEVMDRMWSRPGPGTVRDILDELQTCRPLAYTTVQTVMDRLFHKGWLGRERSGRSYLYEPALTRGEYVGRQMREALATTEDRGIALMHFVSTMDASDYEALREAVRWHGQRDVREGQEGG